MALWTLHVPRYCAGHRSKSQKTVAKHCRSPHRLSRCKNLAAFDLLFAQQFSYSGSTSAYPTSFGVGAAVCKNLASYGSCDAKRVEKYHRGVATICDVCAPCLFDIEAFRTEERRTKWLYIVGKQTCVHDTLVPFKDSHRSTAQRRENAPLCFKMPQRFAPHLLPKHGPVPHDACFPCTITTEINVLFNMECISLQNVLGFQFRPRVIGAEVALGGMCLKAQEGHIFWQVSAMRCWNQQHFFKCKWWQGWRPYKQAQGNLGCRSPWHPDESGRAMGNFSMSCDQPEHFSRMSRFSAYMLGKTTRLVCGHDAARLLLS